MNRICTICARGGSKSIKNKNIVEIAGKPLIAYTLEQARSSKLFDLIAVSSDSLEILKVAGDYGADLLVDRPDELASDTAAKLPVIRHCVNDAEEKKQKKFDVIVDLDATSPLRSIEDIRGAVQLLESEKVSNVITAAPAHRSPYFNLVELDDAGVVRLSKNSGKTIVRRQDAPKCFDMNASIYVWRRDALFDHPTLFNEDTRLFVMPPERSRDIDSELDLAFVEFLMRKRQGS
jgi:CMP-N,N'-diacetyllegionaminic acid synthase